MGERLAIPAELRFDAKVAEPATLCLSYDGSAGGRGAGLIVRIARRGRDRETEMAVEHLLFGNVKDVHLIEEDLGIDACVESAASKVEVAPNRSVIVGNGIGDINA